MKTSNELLKKQCKNGKESLPHLSLVKSAFYCCLHGEDDGGVSIFCLGAEILIMARSVHKNLIGKNKIMKSKYKKGNAFFLTMHLLSLFVIADSSGLAATVSPCSV